jgi:hypothetical protein
VLTIGVMVHGKALGLKSIVSALVTIKKAVQAIMIIIKGLGLTTRPHPHRITAQTTRHYLTGLSGSEMS